MLLSMRWSLLLFIAMVVSGVLVATLVQPVSPVVAAPRALAEAVEEIPVIESPELQPDASNFPEGRFDSSSTGPLNEAAGRALGNPPLRTVPLDLDGFDRETADVASRSEFETTYRLDGGTRVSELSLVPLNVRTSDGNWTEVSTKVTSRNDGRWGGPRVIR